MLGGIREWTSITMLVTGGLLIMLYVAMVTHILEGNKNKWLLTVVSLLLISQIGVVVMGYAFLELFSYKKEYDVYIWLFGIGIGIYYLFFNVGHFMLAEKYSRIAHKVPAMIKGEPEKEVTCWDDFVHWFLWANNILSAIAYGYSLVPYYQIILLGYHGGEVGTFLVVYRIIATYWVRICSIISGYILVSSVIDVKNFFKERDAEDFINTPMLLRHGIAFSLYLIGTTVTAITLMFVNIYPESQRAYDVFSAFYILDFLMEFVSQILLCQVFWLWGAKDEEEEEEEPDPSQATESNLGELDYIDVQTV